MVHERFKPIQMEALCAPHDDVDELRCRGCHDRAHTMYHEEVNRVTGGEIGWDEAQIDDEWMAFLAQWHETNGHCPMLSEGAT